MHRPRITLNIRWGHLFMFMNLVEGPFSRTKKYASILCDFIDHYFLYRNAYQRNAPKTNRTKKNHSLTHTHTLTTYINGLSMFDTLKLIQNVIYVVVFKF